jgi:Domain of unknown function (DUF4476)
MKKSALVLAFAAACSGPVQETKKEQAPASPPAAAVVAPAPADEATVDYRPQSEGHSLLEIASPAGARVDVREGQALIGRDTVPMTVKVQPDHWYAVAARLPSGTARDVKVQARAGQIASVRFIDLAPQGPQAMSREAFKSFLQAVDEEAGDQAKLNLIRSAGSHQWFTSAMAGVLIDHVVHRENKLAVVPILKDRILDRENAFWLYQHFTYREDKAKVQEILEH